MTKKQDSFTVSVVNALLFFAILGVLILCGTEIITNDMAVMCIISVILFWGVCFLLAKIYDCLCDIRDKLPEKDEKKE